MPELLELPEWQIRSALVCLQKQTPKVLVMKPVPHLLQLSSMRKARGRKQIVLLWQPEILPEFYFSSAHSTQFLRSR
jgi:hypothetical protein